MPIFKLFILMLAALFGLQAFALPAPEEAVVLTVTGAISQTNQDDKAVFDWPMLKALGEKQLQTDTSVTLGRQQFTGFLLKDLLEKVGAKGTHVTAIALNDYQVTIPIEDFYTFGVLAAYKMNGKKLEPSDKGPLWIVYPRSQHQTLRDIRYDYRWVWQLIELRIEP